MSESRLRRSIVAVARALYERRLVVATEGNLSARVDSKRILITPTALGKGRLTEKDLILTDLKGRKLKGRGEPSAEIGLHLTVYRRRPDVRAVIHAHPPVATAFTVAGIELAQRSLPEVVMSFGSIPTAPYATPTTPEVGRSIEKLVCGSNAILLEKHGSLTVGKTLLEAYDGVERLEWAAEVTLWARLLGKVEPLSDEQIETLLRVRDTLFRRQAPVV